jgi:hypothetical protein
VDEQAEPGSIPPLYALGLGGGRFVQEVLGDNGSGFFLDGSLSRGCSGQGQHGAEKQEGGADAYSWV